MIKIYWIGGSPCSGKSTVAEIISNKYGLYYFKVDDHLERYTNYGALSNLEICKKLSNMSPEQIWMREPTLQCKEELEFYEEIFDFIMQDLDKIGDGRDIVTEGAAYLPDLIKKRNIPWNRYLSITPTKDFQISHYLQREWIHHVLDGCSNVQKAFENWMNRDILFAEEVNRQCKKNGYLSFINGGQMDIKELEQMISVHFGLEG